jgi:hypothetical protein
MKPDTKHDVRRQAYLSQVCSVVSLPIGTSLFPVVSLLILCTLFHSISQSFSLIFGVGLLIVIQETVEIPGIGLCSKVRFGRFMGNELEI